MSEQIEKVLTKVEKLKEELTNVYKRTKDFFKKVKEESNKLLIKARNVVKKIQIKWASFKKRVENIEIRDILARIGLAIGIPFELLCWALILIFTPGLELLKEYKD